MPDQTGTSQSKQEDKLQFSKLAHSADQVLFKCRTVFPFDFFPDVVIVTPSKVDIIYSHFLFTKTVHSVLIENILTMRVTLSPFFASLQFEIRGYEQNPPQVEYLTKDAAVRAQEIIMGLVTAKHEGIDLKNLQSKQVQNQAQRIGSSNEPVTGP